MYVTFAIHHPKGPREEAILLNSMRKFGEAQMKHKGLLLTTPIKDEEARVLIGFAIWDCKEHFLSTWKELSQTESKRRPDEGVVFEELEDIPHKVYSGEPPA